MFGRAPMMMAPPGAMPMAPMGQAPMNMPPPQMGMPGQQMGMPGQQMGMPGQQMGMPGQPQMSPPPSALAWPPPEPAPGAPSSAPIVRGQSLDEPAPPPPAARLDPPPAPLNMPSPEEFGVPGAPTVDSLHTDWVAAHRRLDQLGALCFHQEKLPTGRCRFTCVMPTAQPDRTHRIDAEAATEAEAVRLALDKAEAWAQQK